MTDPITAALEDRIARLEKHAVDTNEWAQIFRNQVEDYFLRLTSQYTTETPVPPAASVPDDMVSVRKSDLKRMIDLIDSDCDYSAYGHPITESYERLTDALAKRGGSGQ